MMSNEIALRNAREKALLEEEKWLIDNLKRIRAQRNALRVEQLFFQGMKADLIVQHVRKFAEDDNASRINYSQYADGNSYSQNAGGNNYSQNAGGDSYSQNAGGESYSQNADSYSSFQNTKRDCFSPIEEESEPIPEPVGLNPLKFDDFNSLEEQCNETESLDLNVIPDNKPTSDMEQEYDSEEEEVEWDQISFEMGLFVGGHCNQYEDDSNE